MSGRPWWRVALADGKTGYVWGPLLGAEVAAVTPPKVSVPSPSKPTVGVYPKRYKPGDIFTDCDGCPEMVVIPPGRFRMGDLNGGGNKDEKPVHDVRIDYSFAAGTSAIAPSTKTINPNRTLVRIPRRSPLSLSALCVGQTLFSMVRQSWHAVKVDGSLVSRTS